MDTSLLKNFDLNDLSFSEIEITQNEKCFSNKLLFNNSFCSIFDGKLKRF